MDKNILPLIAVRDVVIFPGSTIPISLKREQSVAALEEALADEKRVFLTMQKNKDVDSPTAEQLYLVGTIAKVIRTQRLPDGLINIQVSGETKAKIRTFVQESPFFKVEVDEIEEQTIEPENLKIFIKPIIDQFRKLISFGKPVPMDVLQLLTDFSSPTQILDIIIANLDTKSSEKQALLETDDIKKRIKTIEKQLSNDERISKPILTKYEIAKIIGFRANQISNGSKIMITGV